MRRRRAVFFGQQSFKAGSQRRFDDAFRDYGTVYDINHLPVVITSALCLSDIIPPELRNNVNFVDDYCLFFQGSIINFREINVDFAE
jgi:hypothetical protein